MRTECPNCARTFRVSDSQIGRRGSCPSCKTVFRIGLLSENPANAPATVSPQAETVANDIPCPSIPNQTENLRTLIIHQRRLLGILATLALLIAVLTAYYAWPWKQKTHDQPSVATTKPLPAEKREVTWDDFETVSVPATKPVPKSTPTVKPAPTKLTPTEIFEKCSPAVFQITAFNDAKVPIKTGTGFCIDSREVSYGPTKHKLAGLLKNLNAIGKNENGISLAITNFHVIRGACSVTALSPDGVEGVIYGSLFEDAKKDIAIVSVLWYGNQPRNALKPSDIPIPKIGEKVWAIGNPSGLSNSLSEGIVSGIRNENVKLIQTTAPISPGSSGGPLLNQYGEVVGVTTMTIAGTQNVNFAVSIEEFSRIPEINSRLLWKGVSLWKELDGPRDMIVDYLDRFADAETAKTLKDLVDAPDATKTCEWVDLVLSNQKTLDEWANGPLFIAQPSPYNETDIKAATAFITANARLFASLTSTQLNCKHDSKQILLDVERGLNRCLHLNPNCLAAHRQKVFLLSFVQRRYPEAVQAAQLMVKVAPHCAEALESLGNCQLYAGQFQEATASYDAALKIDPSAKGCYFGRYLVEAKRGNWSAALPQIRAQREVLLRRVKGLSNDVAALISERGSLAHCIIKEGECLEKLAMPDDAARCYSEALRIADEDKLNLGQYSREALEHLKHLGKPSGK